MAALPQMNGEWKTVEKRVKRAKEKVTESEIGTSQMVRK
jgi:hypothetical protein